jgi:hypothetical protein
MKALADHSELGVQTCPVDPDLLHDWAIPPEGQIYATEHNLTRSDGRTSRDGFMWVHLTITSISIKGGFRTLEEAEAAARERAHRFGATFVPFDISEARS